MRQITNGVTPQPLLPSTVGSFQVARTICTSHFVIAFAALLTAGVVTSPAAGSTPHIPAVPLCDPMDCLNNPAPPNGREQHYLSMSRIFGGSDAQRLQVGRATCAMLASGTSPGQVVRDIAGHLGTNNQNADQVMDQAMEDICPGLHLPG